MILNQSAIINVHRRVNSLANLMYEADLAIGACGVTSIERLCLGLCSIVITTAENQVNLAQELDTEKLIYFVDKKELVTKKMIKNKLKELLTDGDEDNLNMPKISDGYGVNRIVNAMSGIKGEYNLRKVKRSDQEILLSWSNEYKTRRNSFDRKKIQRKDHENWFVKMLENEGTYMYIMEDLDGCPLAQIRFDSEEDKKYKISLSVDCSARGYGIGTQILNMGLRYHQKDVGKSCKYYAEVVSTNWRSEKLFLGQGFDKVSESGGLIVLSRDTKD